MSNTLYLVRHAHSQQTALPVETWPLSELGRQQAQRLAELPFWQDVHIICASIEPKALQTAQIVAARRDLPVEPVFDLRELRRPGNLVGDYESAVRQVFNNPTTSVNGWEPAGEAQTRIVTAIERGLMLHEDKTLAVVSHGLALTLYLAYLTDILPSLELWQSISFASAIRVDPDARMIIARAEIRDSTPEILGGTHAPSL
jgi:2,3-bisphosphoglycerate-dependent phosphoglycerate mutase